jgi:hypothetical protein
MSSATHITNKNPFPGLRPFNEDEGHLFFGRESQVDAMVNKLAATRFLAVVGTSGSGKSSLVNCGLRPALLGGLLAGAGSAWRIAQFRPGNDPLGEMARTLAKDGVLFSDHEPGGLPLSDIVDSTLGMSKGGLVDIVKQARLAKGTNLLLVVDQFEELFRYRQSGSDGHDKDKHADSSEHTTAFVNLLLEAATQTTVPIYVVLTMRSDFLGDSAKLPGLVEAIIAGQYLVPPMSHDERRAVIEGPISEGGAQISPLLLTRLVNDGGDKPDQLSILQHALNRTWAYWQHQVSGSEPLTLTHYEAIGSMAYALDKHANRAYGELGSERQRKICEKIFKALTDKTTYQRGIRRPTTMGTLCALADATLAEVTEVLDVFRQPSRSFLIPPACEALLQETMIDISHESLMGVWQQLNTWADEEAQSAQIYQRLAVTAALYEMGQAALLRDPELQLTLDWREQNQPNQTWAARYHGDFANGINFLQMSCDASDGVLVAAKDAVFVAVTDAALAATKDAMFVTLKDAALAAAKDAVLTASKDAVFGASKNAVFLGVKDTVLAASKDAVLAAAKDTVLAASKDAALAAAKNTVLAAAKDAALAAAKDAVLAAVKDAALAAAKDAVLAASKEATLAVSKDTVFIAASELISNVTVRDPQDRQARCQCELEAGQKKTQSDKQMRRMGWSALIGAAMAVGAIIPSVWAYVYSQQAIKAQQEGQRTLSMMRTSLYRQQNDKADATLGTLQALEAFLKCMDDHERPPGPTPAVNILREPSIMKGHKDRLNSAVFSADGNLVMTASDDQTARVWSVKSSEVVRLRGYTSPVKSAFFSADVSRVLTGFKDDVQVRNAITGESETDLKGHKNNVNSTAFSPDGRQVVTASDDNTARVWDATSGEGVAVFKGHDGIVYSGAFSPSGDRVVTASADNTARVWDVATEKTLFDIKGHTQGVRNAAFSPNGNMVVTASEDKTARVWDAATGALNKVFTGHKGTIYSATFSPDSRLVVTTSSDNTARVWDVATAKTVDILEGHEGDVYSAAFSPDGRSVVTASGDKTARVWAISPLRNLLNGPSTVCLARN